MRDQWGHAIPWRVLGLLLAGSIAGVIAWGGGKGGAAGAVPFPAGGYAYLDADASGQLFPSVSPRATAHATRHPIRVSLEAARLAVGSGRLPVVLPDNTRYVVRVERGQEEVTGDWTLVGRVSTPFGELASVMTFGPEGVFGTLPAPDGRMFQVTTSRGESWIEPAGGMLPAGAEPSDPAATDIAIAMPSPRGHALAPKATAQAVDDALHFIDVLGVYTTNLVEMRGSASAAETEFINLFAIANQAHIDSGTTARLRVARLVQTDYPAGAFNRVALSDLTSDTLPDGLGIAALRQETSADLVAMLRPHAEADSTCGIAWLNGSHLDPARANASSGVSVSNVAPCGPLVLAHEIAHNLGSTHDAQNVTTPGAYPYSMGYRQEGPPAFGTVLSYAGGLPWIGRFSDPLSDACEGACGTPLADNVRSLNQMAARASLFTNPPGSIVIDDALVAEGHEATTHLTAAVRLGSPAGAGGVSFEVEVVGDTATLGTDVLGTPGRVTIPEGASHAAVSVPIVGDRDEESDETFRMFLRNVDGAVVLGGEAVGHIVNDDPAARVSGRLVFPPDVVAPTSAFTLSLSEASGATYANLQVEPPLFEYAFEVMPGTGYALELFEHAGFAAQRIDLGVVDGAVERDLVISPSLRVSGKLLFPEGLAPPTSPVDVVVRQSGESGGFGWYVQAAPPGFEFERAGFNRGAGISIEVLATDPFHWTFERLGALDGDVHVEVEVPSTPQLVFISGGGTRESDPPTSSGSPVTVILSGPAPAGGASVRLTAVSDTAGSGVDFGAFDVVLSIPAGATSASTSEALFVLADDIPEPDETVWIVPGDVEGLRLLPGVRGKLVILDDDLVPANSRDVDGDGTSDLLWHSRMEELVRWQLVRGGQLVGEGERRAGEGYGIASLDDFDGDGAVDVVWENLVQDKVVLWRSAEEVGFTTLSARAHPARGWRSVGSVDVWNAGHGLPLWLDATGTRLRMTLFDDWSMDFAVPPGATLVATGDLDGDALGDLLWQQGTSDQFAVWHGLPDGTFADPGPLRIPAAGGTLFAATDVDGDGRDELLWRSHDGAMLRWWSVDGTEPVQDGEQVMPAGSQLVAIGDYDADGRADLAWRDARRQRVWWLRATPGGFIEAPIGGHPGGDWAPVLPGIADAVSGAGGNGGRLAVADVNGDGVDDVAWHNPSLGQFDWWRMRSGARVGLLGRATVHMELAGLGDFDGDGAADIAWRDRVGDLRVESAWNPDNAGPERLPARFDLSWRPVGTADVDGDGREDMLWQHDALRQLQWWSTEGSALEPGGTLDLPAGARLVVTGDLDGDGRDDLVLHDTVAGEGVVWSLGDGMGRTAAFTWPNDPSFVLEAAGDADGDGRADLLWHDASGGRVVWWRMDGARRIASHVQSAPGNHRLAAMGDFDGDGDAEILWRDGDRHALSTWAWTGTGFTDRWIADEPAVALDIPPVVAVRRDD